MNYVAFGMLKTFCVLLFSLHEATSTTYKAWNRSSKWRKGALESGTAMDYFEARKAVKDRYAEWTAVIRLRSQVDPAFRLTLSI